jgi:predicted TIM-barrel fold metal-dependent hydrolase
MPLMPAWDVDTCVAEAKRVAALGMRGVNMTSDPQDLGAPDLANRAWDPFWATCTELELPVHFHIGASITAMSFYSNYPWASHPMNTQLAIGGTLLFVGNARVVTDPNRVHPNRRSTHSALQKGHRCGKSRGHQFQFWIACRR